MQHAYLNDPEYLDSIIITMLRKYKHLLDFKAALEAEDFPRGYDHVLSKRLWGPLFPTLRDSAKDSVPNELLNGHGRFSPGKSPDQIYLELRALALTNQTLFLDRWQYYWGLRNINVVDVLLRRAFSVWVGLSVIALGAAFFGLAVLTHQTRDHELAASLAAIASGSLLWMLISCGLSSLLFVGAFRGTGTFSISYPCEGDAFDPLWGRVIQIGIVAFTVSFVIYGIAAPFLFETSALEHFHLDQRFVIYAAGSLLFCVSIFAGHLAGVHKLMARSRENALGRIMDAVRVAKTNHGRDVLLDHFHNVKRLRTWPIRGAVIAQTAAGIALPVLIQAILLYTGLRAK